MNAARRPWALYPLESVRTPVLLARLLPVAKHFSVLGGAPRWWAALTFDGATERAVWNQALEHVLVYPSVDLRMDWRGRLLHVHGMPRDAAVEAA